MADDTNPQADWEAFLAQHGELVAHGPDGKPYLRRDADGEPDTYVVKQLAEDGGTQKWIAVQEGVMYASDMGNTILLGWSCPKNVLEHAATLWHAYQHHNDADAAAQLDQILEGMLTIMCKAYQIPAGSTSPTWEAPAEHGEDE